MKKIFLITLVLTLLITGGCQSNKVKYNDGNYTGVGEGKYGPIKVEVVVEKGSIKEVNILENEETPGLTNQIFEELPAAIVKKQSTSVEVDAMSGVTMTSDAIIIAVDEALKAAQ